MIALDKNPNIRHRQKVTSDADALGVDLTWITADSMKLGAEHAVIDRFGFEHPDLVFIDGSHDLMHVMNDFVRYGLRSTRFVVFHDTRGAHREHVKGEGKQVSHTEFFWETVMRMMYPWGKRVAEFHEPGSVYGIGVWEMKDGGCHPSLDYQQSMQGFGRTYMRDTEAATRG